MARELGNQNGIVVDANITEVGGDSITLGQKTMVNSFPVVIASDQSPLDVTFASTNSQKVNLIAVNDIPFNLGQQLAAASLPVVLTAAQIATLTPLTSAQLAALKIQGNIAHDGVDAGNPVKVGMRAIAFGANPTAVAAADRTDLYANRAGIQFTIGGHPNIQTLRSNVLAAVTDRALITVSSGTKIIVTKISATVGNGVTVNVPIRIGFGASATPTTTGVVLTHPNVAPGSGIVEGSGAGIVGIGADGDDLRITAGVPTTGSFDVLINYFTIES